MTHVAVIEFLIHLLIFFLGAGIGSFLNVVVYRLPLGISVNNPKRSFCPSCKKQIPWYQNLPLFSWVLLRGKCASCASKIPFRYFFVELLTACVFYAVFLKFRGSWDTRLEWGDVVLLYWIFTALLIAGTFIDIDHFILPHEITFGGLAVGLLGGFLVPEAVLENSLSDGDRTRGFLAALTGACIGGSLLWCVVQLGKLAFGRIKKSFEKPTPWSVTQPNDQEPPLFEIAEDKLTWHDLFFRPTDRLMLTCTALTVNERTFGPAKLEIREDKLKVQPDTGESVGFAFEKVTKLEGQATFVLIPREAMGYGDIFLLAMIGSFLGWQAVLFTIFAASVLGTLFAVIPRIFGKTEWSNKIPFGPYLAGGAMIWLFYGRQFADWYLGRLGGGFDF
jgi:leader peptidase (prepilin peptidase)/N-methyltransferase